MIPSVASYITSAGLKAVTSGGSLGPYFALKYFVPFYDYRIDKTICRGLSGTTSALSISSLNLVSATHSTLFGEKLFANADYQLSDTRFLYWTSDMGTLVEGVTNNNVISQQTVSTDVNLIYGKPLSNTVSGTTVQSTSTGLFTITNTNVLSGSELSQYNPTSAVSWPSSAFYKVASYSPNANGLTSATGSYKCRIPQSTGSYKFNGIAIYAVKVDNNGFDDSGNGLNVFNYNPTLFAVVLFDQAQYKNAEVGGINDFEISVDLGFDWNTVNPGTSANPMYINSNYWIKLPTATSTSAYAINYDGDVVISTSSVPGSWMPRAKLTVTEKGRQQLRLANDDTRFTDFRTIRFPIDGVPTTATNYNDRAVLAIDTSCPDDSLLQMGYATTALGIKSIAMGCYASATGYYNGGYIAEDFSDNSEVTINDIRNDSGGYTVSIGVKTVAQGFGSWATGFNTSSIGYLNFAGGDSSIASYFAYAPDFGVDQSSKNGLNFSFGKLTSAISRQSQAPYSECLYNSVGYSDEADDESYGSNVALGVRSLANGGLAFSQGNATSATGMASWAIGYKNFAQGCFSFSQGANNIAKYLNSWAIGQRVSAMATFGYVFGKDSLAGNDDLETYFSMAIGDNVSATDTHSIGIGKNVLSTNKNSFAIGQQNQNGDKFTVASGINSISIGMCTSATATESIAIGQNSIVLSPNGVSLGSGNIVLGNYATALGSEVYSYGTYALATNFKTSAFGVASLATGRSTKSIGDYSFAGGIESIANGQTSFAFGERTSAIGVNSIALGPYANAQNNNSVAIGYGATTTSQNQVMVGSCDTDNVTIKGKSIILGEGCFSNVSIPGLKQFNDSIGYKISTGMETQDRYQMNIDFYRDGYGTSTITMVAEGLSYQAHPSFKITKITGSINFKFQMSDVNSVGYKNTVNLQVGGVLNFQAVSKIFNWSNVNSENKQFGANFMLCFDDVENSIIFYGNIDSQYTDPNNQSYNSNTSLLKDTSDLSLNDSDMVKKAFYSVEYGVNGGNNWIETILHRIIRIKNCNMLLGEFTGSLNYPVRENGRSNVIAAYHNRVDGLSSLDGLTSVLLYVSLSQIAPSKNSLMGIYTYHGLDVLYNPPIESLNANWIRTDFMDMNIGLWHRVALGIA